MSLVLNTNSGWWWDNILSNQYLENNYPDIDNAILLFPDRYNRTWSALATINWISANMLWWVVSKDDLNNLRIPPTYQSYTWKPPRVWTELPSSSTNYLISPQPIDWLIWSVIGKKIILPTLYMSLNYFSNITWRTWILHNDWTITYFHEAYWYTNTSQHSNDPWTGGRDKRMIWDYGNNIQEWEATTKYITTSWIVVQAWDRPIFQIVSTYTQNLFVNFWSLTPTEPQYKLSSVQISID